MTHLPENAAPYQRSEGTGKNVPGGYAKVNDLDMYYEVHGNGEPLLLLHGGLTTIGSCFGQIIPPLARNRLVIAVEQQAHGHTADIERPLTFEQMADDTAQLVRHLGAGPVDVLGYSDGGNVGLGLAIHHPELVRSLIIAGTNFNNEGLRPEILQMFESATADDMPEDMRQDYFSVAPHPDHWPVLIQKVMAQALAFEGWSREDLTSISAPVLAIIGDADIVRPEHALEMRELIPRSNLAVLPMTDHGMRLDRPELLLMIVTEFLDDK